MQSSTPLFSLPGELRDRIWNLAFGNLDLVPSALELPAGHDYGYPTICHACPAMQPLALTSRDAYRPLLTCHQVYNEGYAIFRKTARFHISTRTQLRHMRQPSDAYGAPRGLRQLFVRIHLRDDSPREQWMQQLNQLHVSFPALHTLHVTAHIRPPVSYENLIDAIFIAGPLSILPSTIKQTLEVNYTEDDIMFARPEFGTVYYHDALDEHRAVVSDLMVDEGFMRFARLPDVDLMTARLLEISRRHEEPWIKSLRAKRVEEERREAMENRRMNMHRQ